MNIIDFEKDYPYEEIINTCIALKNTYEPLITLESIGNSHDHRELFMMKVGYGKKSILCSAGVHARETINPIVLLRMIEEYAISYYRYKTIHGIDSRRLFEEYSIIFVPLLNPDGYMIALYGYESIRDYNLYHICVAKGIPSKEWKYNARAIDLNRNFTAKSFCPTKEMRHSLSENEASALVKIYQKYHCLAYLDFHSRGESIYYYRNHMDEKYNKRQLKIALALANSCGYTLEQPSEEIAADDSGGNTVHYFSEYYWIPALTVETVKDEEGFPLRKELRALVYDQVKSLPVTLLTLC